MNIFVGDHRSCTFDLTSMVNVTDCPTRILIMTNILVTMQERCPLRSSRCSALIPSGGTAPTEQLFFLLL